MKKLLTLMFLISSPAFAEELMLVCRWDATGEHQSIKIYGEGVHVDSGWRITEKQSDDFIRQTINVLMLGTDEPSDVSFSWVINRYTGQLRYSGGDYRRTAQCKKAEKPLF